MAFNPPKCATNMEQRLAALRRDQEIDGLRVYLIKYDLFPRNRDPHNSPIRVEELKELVKHWKLHRQRSFWRDHPEKDDLVRALLQHIKSEAVTRRRRQDAQDKYQRGATRGGNAVATAGAGMSDGAKRDLALLLNGGREGGDSTGGSGGAASDAPGKSNSAKPSLLSRRKVGGDLFYQRGDYDEGLIYLSRIDKTRFQNESENPRNELRHTVATTPTTVGMLVHMAGDGTGTSNNCSGMTTSASTPCLGRSGVHDVTSAHMIAPGGSNIAINSSGPSTLSHYVAAASVHELLELSARGHAPSISLLSRDMKLRAVEGLYNMSCLRGCEAQLLREGGVATLAAVLKTEDPAIRLFSAATLLNLTAVESGNHQAMDSILQPDKTTAPVATMRDVYARLVEDGALAALLELAHSPLLTVKACCARALLRLSVDDAVHFRMVHEGAVAVLVQLMGGHAARVQAPGFSGAGTLTAALPVSASVDVQEVCMHALVNLAAVPRAVTCDALLSTLSALCLRTTTSDSSSSAEDAKPSQSEVARDSSALGLTRHSCAQALLNLSLLPTTRTVMVEDGALSALATLTAPSSTPSLPVLEIASCVLCNLAAMRSNQILMTQYGATNVISALLDAHDHAQDRIRQLAEEKSTMEVGIDENIQENEAATMMALDILARVRRNCAHALAQLAGNAKLRVRIANGAFVPRLLEMLTDTQMSASGKHSDDFVSAVAATETYAVICIAQLTLEDHCRLGLVESGAVRVLLAVLAREEVPGCYIQPPLLQQQQQMHGHGDGEDHDYTTMLKLDCVTALSNLLLHPANFMRMVEEGVVPALLALLRPPPSVADTVTSADRSVLMADKAKAHGAIERAGVYAMLSLARDPIMKTRLIAATEAEDTKAVVPTILAFAGKHIENAELCGASVSILAHLSTCRENDDTLLSEGTAALLVRVLQVKTRGTREGGAAAISTSSAVASSPATTPVAGAKGKAAISASLSYSSSPSSLSVSKTAFVTAILCQRYRTWRDCLAALAQLATLDQNRDRMLEDGILDAVQYYLSTAAIASVDVGTGPAATTARRHIENEVVRARYACAQLLFRLHTSVCRTSRATNGESPDATAFTASLLLLATQAAARNSRLGRGAVWFQQQTVLRASLTIARATLELRGLQLFLMANGAASSTPPLAAGAVAAALNSIMRTGLHHAQVCAAVALCNLARRPPPLSPQSGGAHSPTTDDFIVITLLRINSDATKQICAKALFNLLTHDATRERMVADGVLYALLKLARSTITTSATVGSHHHTSAPASVLAAATAAHEETRDLALRAVYNLSLDAARVPPLLEMEIVRVLVRMYQAELSRELKRMVCGILSNLSSAATVHLHQNYHVEARMLTQGAAGLIKHLSKVRDPETKVYAAHVLYNLSCCGNSSHPHTRGSVDGELDVNSAGDTHDDGDGDDCEDLAFDLRDALVRDDANVLALLAAQLKSENRDVRRYAARTVANLSGNALAVQLMTASGQASTAPAGTSASMTTAATGATTTTMPAAAATMASSTPPMVSVLNDVLKRQATTTSSSTTNSTVMPSSSGAPCVETTAACVFALRNLLTVLKNQQTFIVARGVQTLAAILAATEEADDPPQLGGSSDEESDNNGASYGEGDAVDGGQRRRSNRSRRSSAASRDGGNSSASHSEHENQAQTRLMATELLCALANLSSIDTCDAIEGELGVQLVRDGIIRALRAIASGAVASSSLTANDQDPATMRIISALSNLSRHAECHDIMLRDGALDIVTMLARTTPPSTSSTATKAIPSPFKGLVAVKGESFCHHCIIVLRNLTRQDLPPQPLRGIGTSSATTATPSPPQPGHTSAAASPASDVKEQRLGSQPAVVPLLLALAASTIAETREHVVVALCNVTRVARCRLQLLKNDGVTVLLRLGANATSSAKRHICALTLQTLVGHHDSTVQGDPSTSSTHLAVSRAMANREGLVSAITSLADPHAHDVLIVANNALHAIVATRHVAAATTEGDATTKPLALVTTGNLAVVQPGAAPDWAPVIIDNMESWPELDALSVAIHSGTDMALGGDDEEAEDDEDEDVDGDTEMKAAQGGSGGLNIADGFGLIDSIASDMSSVVPEAKASAAISAASAKASRSPLSPNHSRLRATTTLPERGATGISKTVTMPRACSPDAVLGTLRVMEDTSLVKVRLCMEVELAHAAPRRAVTSIPVTGLRSGAAGDSGELPALRPVTAPEIESDPTASSSSVSSPSNTKKRVSTLSLVRQEAVGDSRGTGHATSGPTLQSPTRGAATPTKRKQSRTLEPLSMPSSPLR